MLTVIETHPIQYHAPVYRVLQSQFRIPVTVIYGSDFSVVGYQDREFGATFAWDTDLLSGYTPLFLSRVSQGGARSVEEVSARRLARALPQAVPKAVLVVGYSPRFHQVALYQAWRAKYPILFRGETTDHARRRGPCKSWIWERTLRCIYQVCNRLLYVGQRSHRHFKRLGCPDEKLVFSPYCVDVSPFEPDEAARARCRPVVRQSLGITEAQTVLLFSGKFSLRKGPDLLLRAIKELPTEIRRHIVVVFLGSGELRETLQALAQGPPPIEAVFLGFQNQTLLSRYYHAADMLILPSQHSETWGLVVNEALHHGLPCVLSASVGCAPDLIDPGVTGDIFETGSARSLAAAIRRAMALIGRPEIRERCRQKVSGYTVVKAAEGIARAYRAVVQ
jgi:glycosyltransferase involved in cell wall biosynthesis